LMANALNANGYRRSDQPVYKAFQRAMSGKPGDGFPGPNTMKGLGMALQSLAMPMPSVPIYPWHSNGAYDGVNAPTRAQWER
jgi:peptidoglycan hydrolase-like protein with peptidoglycan-binding domain